MSGIAISDVVRCAELAWQIYQIGWGQQSGHQYEDFGNDIRCLSENLHNIRRVVENATDTWVRNTAGGSARPRHWNLSSLDEIIGDYHGTLLDCKKLLEENREFRLASNFAYNIDWAMRIQPKIDQLRKRLEAHNAKIAILLKPLELNLLSEIHQDLAARIDAVHRSVLHLHGLLIPDVEQALSDRGNGLETLIPIPPDIESRFYNAAATAYLDISRPDFFPLQAGANALVTHLENSTKGFSPGRFLNQRMPSAIQYLNLLKCVWIVERLRTSDALASVSSGSQWPGYIAQLREEVAVQCQRFNAMGQERLIPPDISGIQNTDDYLIWIDEEAVTLISPHVQEPLEEIMRVNLPSPEGTQRYFAVYKIDSTRYRLVEAIKESPGQLRGTRDQEFSMEVDLRTLNFTPIYATPSSKAKASEVIIHSGSTQTNPTFPETKHVYRLQHLVTGYQVYERYDQSMVKVQFVVAGQPNPIEEHGRIQLWLPKPYQTSSSNSSPSSSETQSIARQSNMSLATRIPSNIPTPGVRSIGTNRNSTPIITTPMSPTLNSVNTSLSAPGRATVNPSTSRSSIYSSFKSSIYAKNRNPSIMTTATSVSRRSTSSVSTINTGKGKARLHEKPKKPLLVLFLKSKDETAKLALVAIEIDDLTSVMQERCKCRTAKTKCTISCIERSKGSLIAQRWNADSGLSSWNLAALGMEQRRTPSDADWNNLTRVSFTFQSMEDRYRFAGGPCSCKLITQHDLSECVLHRHQGIFGEVKQIGSQRLRSYHAERERATGRCLIEGSLPEDEAEFR